MAQVTLRLTIKRRWWFLPYLWAVQTFVPFAVLMADDDTVAAWIDRECDWVVKHGIKISVADVQT